MRRNNAKSLLAIEKLKDKAINKGITLLPLSIVHSTKKIAGVGNARKVGMDAALRRFAQINLNGWIACLDADCLIATNYLKALEKLEEGEGDFATIYFEHQPGVDNDLNNGIQQYELYLRYYVQGLKYCRFPFAFHTIGSSMAVRADRYALAGGMNTRKAGEDFYFLHKLAPAGKHIALNDTCVYPSARISDRVPFGTGKAQEKWVSEKKKKLEVYHPAVFEELKCFFSQVDRLYRSDQPNQRNFIQSLQKGMLAYLLETEVNFFKNMDVMNRHSASIQSFRKRFFSWMDGLRVLKTVHYLRDRFYGNLVVENAASHLLKLLQGRPVVSNDIATLLDIYRKLDREE